jgi:hypothetical protein
MSGLFPGRKFGEEVSLGASPLHEFIYSLCDTAKANELADLQPGEREVN